jgi:DNA invertase Pin-like site-specific DNA recombinase
MTMRTLAYLRVSTGGQDLGQQKLAILDYARQHRITVDDVVEVHASTKRATQRAHVLVLIEALSPGDRRV